MFTSLDPSSHRMDDALDGIEAAQGPQHQVAIETDMFVDEDVTKPRELREFRGQLRREILPLQPSENPYRDPKQTRRDHASLALRGEKAPNGFLQVLAGRASGSGIGHIKNRGHP